MGKLPLKEGFVIAQHDPGADAAWDLLCLRTLIANVCFIGRPGSADWVLVDAGISLAAGRIRRIAAQRFGPERPPRAIILTHGHFDHVGALRPLLRAWPRVTVYAHPLELPFLTGQDDYPPPDPTVGGGLISRISPLFPRRGIDLGERVQPLPADGSGPGLEGWQWIHTPGHTQGHVSLFRPSDRVMVAGDAVVTTKQTSVLHVLTQKQELHGPPAYFTTDWPAAWRSVQRIAALEPAVLAAGHGLPMRGPMLKGQLDQLAIEFVRLAVPDQGRYVPNVMRSGD